MRICEYGSLGIRNEQSAIIMMGVLLELPARLFFIAATVLLLLLLGNRHFVDFSSLACTVVRR